MRNARAEADARHRVDLVLHERDERRDHERRAAEEARRDLVGERLPRAGRHDADAVAAGERPRRRSPPARAGTRAWPKRSRSTARAAPGRAARPGERRERPGAAATASARRAEARATAPARERQTPGILAPARAERLERARRSSGAAPRSPASACASAGLARASHLGFERAPLAERRDCIGIEGTGPRLYNARRAAAPGKAQRARPREDRARALLPDRRSATSRASRPR